MFGPDAELQAHFQKMDRALALIAYSNPNALKEWARNNGVEPHMIQKLEDYTPKWKPTAEMRGAIVHIHRRIAEEALK